MTSDTFEKNLTASLLCKICTLRLGQLEYSTSNHRGAPESRLGYPLVPPAPEIEKTWLKISIASVAVCAVFGDVYHPLW